MLFYNMFVFSSKKRAILFSWVTRITKHSLEIVFNILIVRSVFSSSRFAVGSSAIKIFGWRATLLAIEVLPVPGGPTRQRIGLSPFFVSALTDKNSRNAVSHFQVIERFNGFTFLRVMLETGRTHQIRVHFSHRGTPVAGDAVYGNPKKTYGLEGQCLHAAVLGFIHPITKEYLEFSSDLPDYFKEFLRRIK